MALRFPSPALKDVDGAVHPRAAPMCRDGGRPCNSSANPKMVGIFPSRPHRSKIGVSGNTWPCFNPESGVGGGDLLPPAGRGRRPADRMGLSRCGAITVCRSRLRVLRSAALTSWGLADPWGLSLPGLADSCKQVAPFLGEPTSPEPSPLHRFLHQALTLLATTACPRHPRIRRRTAGTGPMPQSPLTLLTPAAVGLFTPPRPFFPGEPR